MRAPIQVTEFAAARQSGSATLGGRAAREGRNATEAAKCGVSPAAAGVNPAAAAARCLRQLRASLALAFFAKSLV